MKIDIEEYEAAKPHEQSLIHLMSCVNGKYESDYMGLQKAQSIRFTYDTYPKVKALADMSGNSLNIIVNDLVKLAYGVLMENLSDEDSDKLFQKESVIRQEWSAEYKTGENE